MDGYCIKSIIGNLVTDLRKADPTAYITSWNSSNSNKIWSHDTVPPTEESMDSYVEDPHTSKVSKFGRLYGRFCVVTNMVLHDIKQDRKFSAWIRDHSIFLDLSEIPSTRPKIIGFFDRKMPHGTRIDIFQGYFATVAKRSRPYHLFSQTIYASKDSDNTCFAYVIKADAIKMHQR